MGGPVPNSAVGPGIGAFLAFFALAVALYFLMRNMNARMRRMAYRERDRLAALEAAEAAKAEGVAVLAARRQVRGLPAPDRQRSRRTARTPRRSPLPTRSGRGDRVCRERDGHEVGDERRHRAGVEHLVEAEPAR